jgi:hypothetical protein
VILLKKSDGVKRRVSAAFPICGGHAHDYRGGEASVDAERTSPCKFLANQSIITPRRSEDTP